MYRSQGITRGAAKSNIILQLQVRAVCPVLRAVHSPYTSCEKTARAWEHLWKPRVISTERHSGGTNGGAYKKADKKLQLFCNDLVAITQEVWYIVGA